MKKAARRCCQNPRVAKSVTRPRFLKVPNSGGIPGLACLAGLGLLGFPRLGWASLALLASRNNSPAAFGSRAARSAAAVVAGAGKASEADARRGEPSKARPGEHADPDNDKLGRTTTNYEDLRRPTMNYEELAKSISRDIPGYPDILIQPVSQLHLTM